MTKSFRFGLIFGLLFPLTTFAQVVINEIMYDLPGADSGREWVELYNSGSGPVDTTGWKLIDASSHNAWTATQGNLVLPAGGYAIISNDTALFLTDWPGFTGNLFKATFTLPNTSGTLSLKDVAGAIVDTVTYNSQTGAAGDGNSLHRSGATLFAAAATPGAGEGVSPSTTTPPGSSTPSAETSSGAGSIGAGSESTNFSVRTDKSKGAIVNIPVYFLATLSPRSSEDNAQFTWSFGDGVVAQGPSVHHSYEFPGQYVAIVRARLGNQFALGRVMVNVTPFGAAIVSVIPGNFGAVTIVNNGSHEVSLGNFMLTHRAHIFTLPEDLVLVPGGQIRLSNRVSGLISSPGEQIELRDSAGAILQSFVIAPEPETDSKINQLSQSSQLFQLSQSLAILEQGVRSLKVAKISEPRVVASKPVSSPAVLVIERKNSLLQSILAWPRLFIATVFAR